METFLHQTAKSIIGKLNWQQLYQATFVLPSHRAGAVLKHELLKLHQQQAERATWAPTMLTLQQFQDQLSPLYAEEELFIITRLYRHYRSLVQDEPMPLDLFYGWGRQMIADFTNIDAAMPADEVDNFFDNTIAARELGKTDLPLEVQERLRALFKGENIEADKHDTYLQQQYEHLWHNLKTLYHALHDELEAAHKGYSGMRQRAVVEQWEEEKVQAKIDGRIFVFIGFNYLLPVEKKLMQLLKDSARCQTFFYWDLVPNFVTNEKAFSFACENRNDLGFVPDIEAPDMSHPRPVTVMACTSREAQAQYVHRWLQENYKEPGHRVGVVICDETMLESVIYTLPAIEVPDEKEPGKTKIAPVNITKGFPLRNTDVYARVLGWLYDRGRGDVEQLITPDFIGQMMTELFTPDTNANVDTKSLSWRELLILESEFQVNRILNQMRQLVAAGLGDVPFTLKLFRLLLRRVMESVTMPFNGEPEVDLQVMGVLETRLLDFDKLLILNVEEGIIPQQQAENSFIPYYLRKAYHMQTSDERATVYAYNFFRLLSRAGHSTLLFTTTDGSENSKGMSRFIMQMLVSPEFIVEKALLKEKSVLQPFDESRLGTSGKAMVDIMHPDRLSLSPSAINSYITCPRQFCFQYILGLRGPEEEDVIFSPAVLGQFVHATIQHVYIHKLHYTEGVFTPVSPDDIERVLADEECLAEALKAAYESVNADWAYWNHSKDLNHYKQSEHRREESTILTFVRNILERDLKDAQVGLSIYLQEAERYFFVDVPEVGKVKTGGRIDRVDFYGPKGQEKLRIVDYKSGSYKKEAKTIKGFDRIMEMSGKGYMRQTLIYSHALMESESSELPIEPNLYFCCRHLKDEKTTLTIDNKELTDYRAVAKDFMDALVAKMHEILTTREFPPCDESKCPSYCLFKEHCRRKPQDHSK